MALEIDQRTQAPDVTVLVIRGRITLGRDTRQLEEAVGALERDGVRRLVFDLSGVEYMDSAGLGVLTRCRAAMRNNGGAFHLAGVNAKVQSLLRVTRLDGLIPTFPTADEAGEAFREPRA